MREIEVKILDIDVDDIKHRLDKAGAVYLGERLIQEKAFDFPDQRIRASNSLCRLRKIGNAIEFAFKGNREKNAQFQIAEETEVVVSDFEKTEKILVSLGLSAYRDREKRRISYMLADTHVEIEICPNIPPYIELEGTEESIPRTLEQLGFSMSNTTNMTNSEVYKHYGKDPHVQKFEKT